MPHTPSRSARAKSGTLLAIAFNVPMPVITIRFFKSKPCLYKSSKFVIFHCDNDQPAQRMPGGNLKILIFTVSSNLPET
jgi:hypothetical protein